MILPVLLRARRRKVLMRIDSQPWTRHMAQRREQGADDHEKVGMKRIGIEFVARLVAAALAHASPCAAGRRLPKAGAAAARPAKRNGDSPPVRFFTTRAGPGTSPPSCARLNEYELAAGSAGRYSSSGCIAGAALTSRTKAAI